MGETKMAGKNQYCPLCGFRIKRPDGYLTKWQGKSAHCGCVLQKTIADQKTLKMLQNIKTENSS